MVSRPANKTRRSTRKNGAASVGPAALRRIIHIHERLGNCKSVTAVSLASELGVSDRTIKRDIEQMRTELGAAIVWEPATQTYFYEHPCDFLPLLRISADEALSLALAGETFAAWRGSPLGRALTGALKKIASVTGGAVSVPASEVRSFVFQPPESADAEREQEAFARALEAIRRRREIEIVYRKPQSSRAEKRVVHPLHLALLDHRWVLVAHDPAKSDLRNFLLARIYETKSTGRQFTSPPGFDINQYLAGSMGRFTGDTDHHVRIRFDSVVAPYIREREWHPSQEVTEGSDGAIEVTLRLNNLVDVRRWILACGSHAEVLKPPELRREITEEIKRMGSHYDLKSEN